MENHPEGKEYLAEEWPPGFIPAVQSVGKSSNNTHQVDDEKGCWRDEKCCPLDHVELTELSIICSFCSHSEVGVKASYHLQKSLEDGEEVG